MKILGSCIFLSVPGLNVFSLHAIYANLALNSARKTL